MRNPRALILATALLAAACAPLPQRADIPTRWQPSPNFNARQPDFVILHHTGDDAPEQALRTLTNPALGVSAHYLVGRAGEIYQLVDEKARAWHAGQARWGSVGDVNSASLGIELDNNGDEPFPETQVAALLSLLEDIKRRHGIPAANFIGHADVAPRRKVDPSRHFPWRTLAARGFGLWCDPPYAAPPAGFDPGLALHALGYDVSDVEAAIGAFKLHYVQDGSPPLLTQGELALLHCLAMRKATSR